MHELTIIAGTNVPLLNPDQLGIYDCIIEAIILILNIKLFYGWSRWDWQNILYNILLAKIRSRGEIALAMASSRIPALLLQGGRIVHSRLKVLQFVIFPSGVV